MKFLESTWEQHFISESQLLEEMLTRGELRAHGSRLQIAIENNILDWNRYSQWAQNHYELPLLKRGLYKDQIEEMKLKIAETKQILGEKIDENLLVQLKVVPYAFWDGVFFVLTAEPQPRMIELKFDFLPVLAPPEIITVLSENVIAESTVSKVRSIPSPAAPIELSLNIPAVNSSQAVVTNASQEPANQTKDSATSQDPSVPSKPGEKILSPPKIQGPFLDPMLMAQNSVSEDEAEKPAKKKQAADVKKDDSDDDDKKSALEIPMDATISTDVDFGALLSAVVQQSGVKDDKKSKAVKTPPTPKTADDKKTNDKSSHMKLVDPENYWKKVGNEHETMSSSARKNFDGYAVLRLVGNQTSLFKMDEELEKESVPASAFAFNVETQSFFRDCLRSRKTDSTSFKKLELKILDFNYLCATPLFLGDRPVGFILGFTVDKLNEQDEIALQKLSESA